MMYFVTVSRRLEVKQLTLNPAREWADLTREYNRLIVKDYKINDIKFSTIDTNPYIQETVLIIAVEKSKKEE